MNAFARWICASLLVSSFIPGLNSAPRALGESRIQKSLEPKFYPGCPVLWSDGSRGIVVKREEFRDDQWYYLVQLGGDDGLCWSLPEAGLRFRGR